MTFPTTTLINEDGTDYECGPDACGYVGGFHCRNCGYSQDEV